MNDFLQFLIPDRDYGYLFPHSRSVAAFGCVSEYHITKHRPHLTEGVHYIKSAGNGTDHVVRVFYTFSGLLLLADLVGTAPAVQLKQALLDHVQRQAQAPGALVPSHGGGVAYTQPQRQPQVAPAGHDDPTPYGQPVQMPPWGQTALHQPGAGQLVPNAHGYLPVIQGAQPYGQISGQASSHAVHPAEQVAAALSPYVDRSVSRHLGTVQSQQEQSLQLVEAVTTTMLRAQQQAAEHMAHAYEQASGNPKLQPQQQAAPAVLLLHQRSATEWLKANDGWFTLLLGASVAALVGVGTWLIASIVLHGMLQPASQGSQPVRLAPAYPSSGAPFN